MKMNIFFMFLSFFRNFGRGVIRLFNIDIRLNILLGVLILLVYTGIYYFYKTFSIINSFSTYHCIVFFFYFSCYNLIWGIGKGHGKGQGNGWGAKGSTSDINVAGRSNPYVKASFNANFDTFAYAFDMRTGGLRGDFRYYNTFTYNSFMIGKRDGNAVMKNANILLTSRGLIYNKNINLGVRQNYFIYLSNGLNASLGFNSFIHTSSVLNDDINNSINNTLINSNNDVAKSDIDGDLVNGYTLSKVGGIGGDITGGKIINVKSEQNTSYQELELMETSSGTLDVGKWDQSTSNLDEGYNIKYIIGSNTKDNSNRILTNIKADVKSLSEDKANKIANVKIRQIERVKRNEGKIIKGGYLSYINHSCYIGHFDELIDKKILINRLKDNLISQLEEGKIYSILLNMSYLKNGVNVGISPMKSMIITATVNLNLLGHNIINAIILKSQEYEVQGDSCNINIYWREWLRDDEYSKLVSPVNRDKIIEEVLIEEGNLTKNNNNKLDKILKFMAIEKLDNYINQFPSFDSITKLTPYDLNSDEGSKKLLKAINDIEKESQYKVKISVFKSDEGYSFGDSVPFIYLVFTEVDIYLSDCDNVKGVRRTVCFSTIDDWVDSISHWNTDKYPYLKFTDVQLDKDKDTQKFTRTLGAYKFHVDNGKVQYWEKYYSFPDMLMPSSDKKRDTKIGSLDLETYGKDGNGFGEHSVYAGGIALNDGYKQLYYLDLDNEWGIKSGAGLIQQMFIELFDYIAEKKKERNGYKLYAHNLGRFDSIFLISSLANAGFQLRANWRENDLLQLYVIDTDRKLNIKLLDSINLVPTSLDKLLKGVGSLIRKGMFPHKYVNRDTINYIGPKPGINYYLDESQINEQKIDEYNKIPELFNLKEQCLNYLETDVLGLLEAMNILSKHYHKEHKVNITNFSTLPALSLAIFGYWFYQDKKKTIKMIKGPLESFIRQAYFGGNSDIFVEGSNRFVKKGLHYDMNSQYPFAMKNQMPTGNPVFSNNTDLNYYSLGFVFAKITPPNKDTLANLFIPFRNTDGSVSCPRETFYEFISTVELRQGLEYGYKAEILCGVNFPEACEANELFGKFVDQLYEIKATSTDSVERMIAKLSLNSTYGKFGQKEKEYRIKIMKTDQVSEITDKYHYSYLSDISDGLSIIKYGPRLNEKYRQLYKEHSEFDDNKSTYTKERGIPSAVQISAMISSYARTSINPFKNIPGNIAIASNTDSLILEHPLPNDLIGRELGQWKLEHTFNNGIFVRPKLYCYEDSNTNELIRKAAGVNAAKLTSEDYAKLCKGENVHTQKEIFKVDWNKLKIEVVKVDTTLKGINPE
uniref:Probable DNA polymerase n=3 Tax=unclassified Termitomyces TaxID=2634893 RepID=A0A8H2S9W4_9AGAR|nr:DNA polymerase [Termitomyces sp. T132]QWO71465.1 DNA polymerase [Termitomyces sp. T8]